MKIHLDHDIRLSTLSEYASLYRWSLQEFSEGKKIGSDQVPWNWTLYFTASALHQRRSIAIGSPDLNPGEDERLSTVESDVIVASVHPAAHPHSRVTRYRMFGTERSIDHFTLKIHKLKNEDPDEKCSIWGCVSYTSEIDFRDHVESDTVEIHVSLRSSRFESLCALIAQQTVETLQIQLAQVSGFYSPWSPSISTDEIAILAAGDDQEVALPDGCEILPPRLGTVGKFELTLTCGASLGPSKKAGVQDLDPNQSQDEHLGKDVSDADSSPPVPAAPADSHVLADQLRQAIHQLRTPLWVLVALLLLLLSK